MACPFLDKAPLEIRCEIYSYLLSVKYTKRPVREDEVRFLQRQSTIQSQPPPQYLMCSADIVATRKEFTYRHVIPFPASDSSYQ